MTIISHNEIAESVKALHKAGGLPSGTKTGWRSVDELYTVAMGQWTVITGTPNSGKSEWLDALLVNLAKQGGWHHVIFSPENMPLELHYAKVIEKYVGRPFNPGPTQRVSEEELDDALAWMAGKFHFVKPERPSMPSILEEANRFSNMATRKCGIVVDPWNYLEHHRPQGMSMTEYVSSALSEIIEWVRPRNCHFWLVAHPSKMQKNKEGKLPVPTPHDISDSAHFWNKADNCVTVWRDQSDYTKQEVDIHVQKVRFKHIGHIGLATLVYDRTTGRYHERPKAPVIDMKERSSGVDF